MSMRLIDAEDIPYTMLYKENWMKGNGKEAQGAWKSDIDKMPTIDAVPVVRCWECKAFMLKAEKPRYMCLRFNGLTDPKPSDYCAYGERRSDDK